MKWYCKASLLYRSHVGCLLYCLAIPCWRNQDHSLSPYLPYVKITPGIRDPEYRTAIIAAWLYSIPKKHIKYRNRFEVTAPAIANHPSLTFYYSIVGRLTARVLQGGIFFLQTYHSIYMLFWELNTTRLAMIAVRYSGSLITGSYFLRLVDMESGNDLIPQQGIANNTTSSDVDR